MKNIISGLIFSFPECVIGVEICKEYQIHEYCTISYHSIIFLWPDIQFVHIYYPSLQMVLEWKIYLKKLNLIEWLL